MRSVNYKWDFVGKRKWFFFISAVLLGAGILSLLIQGLNLGIDFKSGTRIDISVKQPADVEQAKKEFEKLGYEDPFVRSGQEGKVLIFRTDEALDKDRVLQIQKHFQKFYGDDFAGFQEQRIDPVIGRELARNAIIATLLASIGIILYMTIRFEYRFAVAAVLALVHDALFVIGAFSILQLEVDVVFIAAVLTIIGYSVNDTIVIFDRIRELMALVKPKSWEDLSRVVNESIHQTLIRSINTGITVLFAGAALFLFGGESIRYFSLALLLGLTAGMYSSLCLASQIWVVWKWRSMQRVKERPAN
jgi:preprotein translocase subunit SecF